MEEITRLPEDLLPKYGEIRTHEWTDDDDVLALAHVEMSQAAYLPTTGIYRKAVKTAGWLDGEILDLGSAEVALCWTPEVINISVRGTKGLMDIIRDLESVFKRPFAYLPVGKMAMGFKRHVNEVLPALLRKVAALLEEFPEAVLVMNGHSLGGGMIPGINLAFLAESKGSSKGKRWIPVVTFVVEGPRVFNRKGADWYRDHVVPVMPHMSIINVTAGVADIVPQLPFKWMGYADHLERYVITAGKIFFGWNSWELYESENPSPIPQWAKISRVAVAVHAHGTSELAKALRARIAGSSR